MIKYQLLVITLMNIECKNACKNYTISYSSSLVLQLIVWRCDSVIHRNSMENSYSLWYKYYWLYHAPLWFFTLQYHTVIYPKWKDDLSEVKVYISKPRQIVTSYWWTSPQSNYWCHQKVKLGMASISIGTWLQFLSILADYSILRFMTNLTRSMNSSVITNDTGTQIRLFTPADNSRCAYEWKKLGISRKMEKAQNDNLTAVFAWASRNILLVTVNEVNQ
jgi:hypothetical protein